MTVRTVVKKPVADARFRRIWLAVSSCLEDDENSAQCSSFARTLTRDIEAVRRAIAELWSNGQAEGQIISSAQDAQTLHVRRCWH
jgi:transposase